MVVYRANGILHFYLIAILGVFFICLPLQAQQESGIRKVVIDAGHGGSDPGALGSTSKEKDVTLKVALKLGKKIADAYPDVEVIYTRKTDVAVSLYRRAEIANKANADLFISIHCNSVANRSASPKGAETLVMGTSKAAANLEAAKIENSVMLLEEDYELHYEGFDPKSPESFILFSLYQNAYLNHSLDFAVLVQQQLKSLGRVDRGVKQAGVYVLWKTALPSALIELGFMTNPTEEKWMNSTAGQEALAKSIFSAFSTYKTEIDKRSKVSMKTTETPSTTPSEPSKIGIKEPVEFCVQVAASTKPISTTTGKFKNYKGIEEIKISATSYKYIAYRSTDYESAVKQLKTIRKTFSDAFVMAKRGQTLLNLQEARAAAAK